MAAGMVPPLALGLATMVARRKFDNSAGRRGKENGVGAGAVALYLKALFRLQRDPIRVLPCWLIRWRRVDRGHFYGGRRKLMAPHGGLFVLLIPSAITAGIGIPAGNCVAPVRWWQGCMPSWGNVRRRKSRQSGIRETR